MIDKKAITELRRRADRAVIAHRTAKAAVRAEEEALDKARKELGDSRECQSILQTIAQSVQTKAHGQISLVVTRALRAVFPAAGYSFKIAFSRKRGKTDASLKFVRSNTEIDPTDSDSGGAVHVAAFALRLARLLLATPKRRPLLILDEPFGGVSADFVPAVAELLEVLARDLGVQIIISTHQDLLKVGKVIDMGNL